MSDNGLLSGLKLIGGSTRIVEPVVFSIMKNELFFVRAFLHHYRSIGANHFLIIDDGSDDGTREYLLDQHDVSVYQTKYRYGQVINRQSLRFWASSQMRAGVRLKAIVPLAFSSGKWCIYADADEFLILPKEFSDLASLLDALDAVKIPLSIGVMVEMYPKHVSTLKNGMSQAHTLSQLLTDYGHFDAVPLLHVTETGEVYRLNDSASGRLFRRCGIIDGGPLVVVSQFDNHRQVGDKRLPIGSATQKIPLIKPSNNCHLVGSHKSSARPSPFIGLTVLHFKFTSDSFRRIALALKTKSWSRGSEKYTKYQQLIMKMSESETFMGDQSERLHSIVQLEKSRNLWSQLGSI